MVKNLHGMVVKVRLSRKLAWRLRIGLFVIAIGARICGFQYESEKE